MGFYTRTDGGVKTTVTGRESWYVRADFHHYQTGEVVSMCVGTTRGMTDSGQPGWTSSSDATHYGTVEQAVDVYWVATRGVKSWLAPPYQYDLVEDSVQVVRQVYESRVTVVDDVVPVPET